MNTQPTANMFVVNMEGSIYLSVCLCIIVKVAIAIKAESVSVDTDIGTFNGYVRKFKALNQELAVQRYFGIPYAEPPVGNLRFQKPVRKERLEAPYDATKHRPSCQQQNTNLGGTRKPGRFDSISYSEDCLYLNIYTPGDVKGDELLPVMIYIHGGGFAWGSPQLYSQDVLSAYGRVVAVTVAYRLSVWGFLSTGDKELPGNYGLWDQHMAIQWVHDNIVKFRGDPNSVTIFGTSAGSGSVVYQGLYPGNQGLIHRVSAQSGSVTCPWALNNNPIASTKRLGELLGCDVDKTTKEIADCFKSASSNEIRNLLVDPKNNFSMVPYDFIPSVDGEFLPESPHNLFHGSSEQSQRYRNSFASLDLIVGVTSGEGMLAMTSLVGVMNPDEFKIDRDTFENHVVPGVLQSYFGKESGNVLKQVVLTEYTNWEDPDDSFQSIQTYIRFMGDYFFNFQTVDTARVHASISRKKTFVYVYDALVSHHLFPVPAWADTAQHVDELTTLLGYDLEDGYITWTTPYPGAMPDDWEIELSKVHMKLWANFAKTGDPNTAVDQSSNTFTWPEYDVKSEYYLRISRQMSEKNIGQRAYARAANLWLNVLPDVINSVTNHKSRKAEMYCDRDGDCKP